MSVARVVRAVCAAAILSLTLPLGAHAASPLTWSGRFLLDPPDGSERIISPSCPTATLCAVGDTAGNVITSTHPRAGAAAWKRQNVDGTNLTHPACTLTLCVAVAGDGKMSSTTSPSSPSWSAAAPIDPGNGLQDVACPSSKLCIAVDNAGQVVTSTTPTDFSQWSATPVDAPHVLKAISCPSTTFCVAVDNAGNAVSSTNPAGAVWTLHTGIDSTNQFEDVACASKSLCLGVDDAGNIASTTTPTTNTPWKTAKVDFEPPNFSTPFGVACPWLTLCVVVDDGGFVFTSRHPTGPATAWQRTLVDGRWSLIGLSCAHLPLCVATDQGGNVVVGRLRVPNTKITAVTIDKQAHTATFKFVALGIASGFRCKLQRGTASASFSPCRSPKTYKKLKAGSYTFRVRAVNSSGPDPTPAVATFKIPKSK